MAAESMSSDLTVNTDHLVDSTKNNESEFHDEPDTNKKEGFINVVKYSISPPDVHYNLLGELRHSESHVFTDSKDGQIGRLIRVVVHDDCIHQYNMEHPRRGLCVIINNEDFSQSGLSSRAGSDVDAQQLFKCFATLGFDVRLYKNMSCAEMIRVMKEVSHLDHYDADCFACVILSHGNAGKIHGVDKSMDIDRLFSHLKGPQCQSLIGKPKLFFIQACRGERVDNGVKAHIVEDSVDVSEPPSYRIPTEADFLYAYSTVEGYLSWRNCGNGSWFVQAMCDVINEYGQSRDLLWLMTRTNYVVAHKFESVTDDNEYNGKKQIPSFVSTLRKELVFTRKPNANPRLITTIV